MTETGWRLERQISIALLAGLIVQTGGALLWAGRAAERIDRLEAQVASQAGVSERLARLEEQALATRAVLVRIEAKLDRGA